MPTTTNFSWTTPADTDYVKDGASAIRTLANGIDTSMAQLKGGTTGQILSKTSGTDMAFTWINNDQGDITAVVAGNGLSGGATSGSATLAIDTAITADLSTNQTLTNKKLSDSTTSIVDATDATKVVKFDVTGTTGITATIATAFTTAKTITIPDATDTLVGKATTDTLTNKTINGSNNTISNVSLTTAVTGTLPIANGGTNLTTFTTGDLPYASASNTLGKLAIGTSGQVLTVSGGVPTWAAASSGGGLTLLATETLSGSSYTTSSISSSYKNLVIEMKNCRHDSDIIWVRCNSDTGNNYYYGGFLRMGGSTPSTTFYNTNAASSFMVAYDIATGATNLAQATIRFKRYTDTDVVHFTVDSTASSTAFGRQTIKFDGIYDNSAAISTLTFSSNTSGNLSGTVYIYGES